MNMSILPLQNEIDFLSSIALSSISLSQIDILPVIRTLLNSASCVLKKEKKQGWPLHGKVGYLIMSCSSELISG